MKGKTIGSTPSNTYEVQLCTITSCDPTSNTANAKSLNGGNPLIVDLSVTPANVVIYPAPGEAWYVKRLFKTWVLESKHSYQNDALTVPASAGDMVINNSDGAIIMNSRDGSIALSNILLGQPAIHSGTIKTTMLPVTDANTGLLLGYLPLYS